MRPDGTPAEVIVFIRNGRLMAQALDDSATLEGSPVELAQEASQLVAPAARPFSAGGDVLAFVARSGIETRPTWVDRRGRVLGPAASVSGQLRDIRLSPDASRLSVSRLVAGSSFELLLVDLRPIRFLARLSGCLSRKLTGIAMGNPWSASSRRDQRPGQSSGFPPRKAARQSPCCARTMSFRPLRAFHRMAGTSPTPASTTGEVSTSTFAGCPERASWPLVADPSYEASPRISPDGRWFAYH